MENIVVRYANNNDYDMVEYFFANDDKLEEKPCAYECCILAEKDFLELYIPEWSNAINMVKMTAKTMALVEDINKRDS